VGQQREAGSELSDNNFVTKLNWRLVSEKNRLRKEVIAKITGEARTGEIGGGQIFCIDHFHQTPDREWF
ncbi:hypothetical protein MKW98_002992, partial [Papaver atlanticum]